MEKIKNIFGVIGILMLSAFVVICLMHLWGFLSYVLDGGYPHYGARDMFETITNWPWYVLTILGGWSAFGVYRAYLWGKECEDAEA
ncbi:MAG: hypothetical protein JST_000127 [Candidatus Parcubacteria bacterium]|jgi:hypothetical protein|nr:MAG: hypothetical protein JST_1120 [Candidatus Parcubacteria bacterium]